MNIADRIQNLRKTKDISQEELANVVGVSRQAVSKWESAQSIPDLDKIIILSEYFEVTTDYILKGVESRQQADQVAGNTIAGQILYISSTAFLAIGLLCAFAGWYAEQSAESIWGSMIIQAVGVAGYYIGKIISREKAPFALKWINTMISLFIPLSLLVSLIFRHPIAPYPIDIRSTFVFAVSYLAAIPLSYFILRRQTK